MLRRSTRLVTYTVKMGNIIMPNAASSTDSTRPVTVTAIILEPTVLRYKMKKLNRPFRIGKGGNGLMWLVGGLGFCGSLLAFVLSFIPPSQISTGSNTVWFSVLIIGALIVVIAPFIIYASKKPSWVDPNSTFEPFHWEEQPAAQVAGKTATATATAGTTASATANESVASPTGNAPSANNSNNSGKAPNIPPKG